MSESFDGTMPTQMPLAPEAHQAIDFDNLVSRRPDFAAAPMPEAPRSLRERLSVKAGAVIAAGTLAIAGAAGFLYLNHEGNGHVDGAAHAPNALGAEGASSAPVKVCPEGVFPRGLFESNLAISTPGDLNTRPAGRLGNAKDLTEFEFGKNGVACDGAATLGTIKMAMLDIMGDGAAKAQGFDTFSNIDAQIGIYKKSKSTAEDDAKNLASIFQRSAVLNPKKITGAYQQVVGVKNPDGSVTPAFKKKDVDFAPHTTFEFTAGNVNGDSPAGDRTQVFLIDRETGQMFVRNSIGLKELKPQQKPTPAAKNQGKTGGSSAPSGGKAVGKHEEQNSGPANNNQNVGNTPEAANNGTDNTPGGGSGGGGGGETGTTTPGTTPGTVPSTVPNTTTPSTVPPTTAPPTTNAPKGTDPGCKAPNPACS